MINNKQWKTFNREKQNQLSENAYSFRQCQKCLNHIHLGEDHEEDAEGMYLNLSDFDNKEQDILSYEKKNKFLIDDYVFCWKCIKKITKDLKQLQMKGVNNEAI